MAEQTVSTGQTLQPDNTNFRINWVYQLKKTEVDFELQKFGLGTTGTVDEKKKRLVKVFKEGKSTSQPATQSFMFNLPPTSSVPLLVNNPSTSPTPSSFNLFPPPLPTIPTTTTAETSVTLFFKTLSAKEIKRLYDGIIRNLVRRYVTVEQRKAENQGVTEDDVNEIKQDISAFRFELIEILKNSGMNTSTAHSGMGTGGKKNRQKERRLMKGFNIGPQHSSTTSSLPPVAEFIASLQGRHQDAHNHDFFGSSFSGIFNSTTRKLHQQSSTVSSSQGSINEGHPAHYIHRGFERLHFRRSQSQKRKWGTLIEAAKTGKVSRLIGRSRSEDSVCNRCREGHNHSHSHSNSPASDDNASLSPSDSNRSLDVVANPELELHGLAHGLALLKTKRSKFSASRNTRPTTNQSEITSKKFYSKRIPQVLKRASSVPSRAPDACQALPQHNKARSQQDSIEIPGSAPPTLTPSTTEESVTAMGQNAMRSVGTNSSREPLLYNSSSSTQATGSSHTPDDEFKESLNLQSLPKLPGVTPLSGHNNTTGWL